jgi:uncharacterized membrane protein
MTRQEFIARLQSGLSGLPEKARSDIIADYETHFSEGAQAGRSEADIAAALGDPDRLARELRAEAGLKRWETERNPESAVAAIFALVGLGAIDVLFLLPILIAVVSIIIAMYVAAAGGFVVGAIIFAVSPFAHHFTSPWGGLLFGLGLMALSVANASIQTLLSIGLVNLLVWYGRLHFQLLKPAIDPAPPQAPRELASS